MMLTHLDFYPLTSNDIQMCYYSILGLREWSLINVNAMEENYKTINDYIFDNIM